MTLYISNISLNSIKKRLHCVTVLFSRALAEFQPATSSSSTIVKRGDIVRQWCVVLVPRWYRLT
jgi:hypothetical protein